MAAPHVSGIAALIISQGVTNPAAVEALIRKPPGLSAFRTLALQARNQDYGLWAHPAKPSPVCRSAYRFSGTTNSTRSLAS